MTDAQFYAILNQLTRIANAIEKLADIEEHADEVASRAAALEEWRTGSGKHPDD